MSSLRTEFFNLIGVFFSKPITFLGAFIIPLYSILVSKELVTIDTISSLTEKINDSNIYLLPQTFVAILVKVTLRSRIQAFTKIDYNGSCQFKGIWYSYGNMIVTNKTIYVLMILINKSWGEICFPFLTDPHQERMLEPERVWRYDKAAGIFQKLEYLKANDSALCSVDFVSEAKDLEGKVINVIVFALNSYLMLKDHNITITGAFGDAWSTLEEILKFKSVYSLQSKQTFALLKTGKYDIILTASLIQKPSSVYYTHSTVMGKNSYSLFTLPEGTFVSKWWYTRIFEWKVWIASTLFVITLTCTITGIATFKKKICNQSETCEEFGRLTFNLLCVLGATSGQGFQELPRSWSLRMCALTALYLGMLISCGFNSTLTSYLAFRTPYVRMNNLQDVRELGTHSLCVRNKSHAYEELSGVVIKDEKPKQELLDQWAKILNRNCPSMDDPIELRNHMCKPNFVYVEELEIFLKEYQHVQDKCRMVRIPGKYWSSKTSFVHYRGSKYRKIIDTYLLRLHSTGIMNYLKAKWSYQDNMEHTVYTTFQQVELGHIQLLLAGLAIMTVVSIIICILENIWFRLNENSVLRNQQTNFDYLANANLQETIVITRYSGRIKRLRRGMWKKKF